jgi:hypothetical protein
MPLHPKVKNIGIRATFAIKIVKISLFLEKNIDLESTPT